MPDPKAADALSSVTRVLEAFNSDASPGGVYAALLQALLDVAQSSTGCFVEFSEVPGEENCVLRAVLPEDSLLCGAFNSSCASALHQAAERSEGACTIIGRPEFPSGLAASPCLSGIRSLLLVPVVRSGRLLAAGALFNRRAEWRSETTEEIRPIVSLAATVAGAYEAARRSEEKERELRDSEIRLRQVIDLVPHHIFAIVPSKGGRFIFANKALAEVYGMTTEDVVGKTQRDITPSLEEEERFLADDLEVVRSGREKFIPEEIYTDPSGKVHYLQTTKIPFQAVGSAEPAVLGICVDITEQKRLEAERRQIEENLQQGQKLESLGVLAGGVAHDFNNLLTGILGHASLALLDIEEGSPLRARLKAIEITSQRAAELCRQLLAYSGKGKFEIKPLNLSAIVEEMSDVLSVSISKKAELKRRLDYGRTVLEGDASQVRQVIVNLITNASEALPAGGGTIEVETGRALLQAEELVHFYPDTDRPPGEYVYLRISDDGCGMDEAVRTKIFDPFFSTKSPGRGLGMPAVLGVLRGHKGGIRVETSKGQGSRFTVIFPGRGMAAESCAHAPQTALDYRGSGTVLVIDDEEAVRDLACLALERFGFQTISAQNGIEGLKLFRTRQAEITAVLLDLTMPKLSGEEVLQEIRRISSSIPVILSSGFSEQEAVGRFGGQGPSAFIQKPYTTQELAAVMKNVLQRHSE